MNILITGGAGFIGSHLADALVRRGDSVTVVDNFATARRDNLFPHENLQLVEDTITKPGLIEGLVRDTQSSLIIHCAASYKDPDDWEGDALVNTVGSAIVAGAAKKTDARLIYFQTALCYGLNPGSQPLETDHRLEPGESSYAISKTAGEYYIRMSRVDFVSFRLANVYGPRNVSGPLPTFYQRLKADKPCFVMDTRRDFIYVEDLVDCVLKAVDGTGHGIYHISSGSDYAIFDLFHETVTALGIHLEEPVEVRARHEGDAPTILLDPTKTREEFGWAATTPLAEGIRKAVKYYDEYGVEETFTHLVMPDRGE